MKKHTVTVTIDFDEIFDSVYAESAWHAAHNPSIKTLTSDNRKLLAMRLKEGYADLRERVAGYLERDNFNPNIDEKNIVMEFAFYHQPAAGFEKGLHETIVALLANYLLMRFYGDKDERGPQYGDSLYMIEWRRHKAKLIIAFVHDLL